MRHSLLERLEDRVLLAGTPVLVGDLNTNGLPSYPADFTVFANALYFTAYDATNGRALWRYDGVKATMVADIDPGQELYSGVGPEELTVFDGALYFRALNHASGFELWKYDGTAASLAADIKPDFTADPQFNSSRPSGLTVIGDRLYFSADDGVSGREIWSFDGQTASRLSDLNPGAGDSEPYGKTFRFTEFAGAMYFFSNPGDNRDHLFKFDGQNIVRVDQAGGAPLLSDFYDDEMIVFDGALYFTGAAPGNNLDREFWKYDGNSFSRVADIREGPDGSWPSGYFIFNDTLYFWAQRDPSIGLELFKFDGVSVTPSGESRPYPQGDSAVLDGVLYRSAGEHLFRFDGSHFTQVSDVPIGGDIATFGGAIYLAGQFQLNGLELARYDGQSITLVADLRPGTDRSDPGNFVEFNGKLYFMADSDQSSHDELWVYDGSSAQIADPSGQYFEPTAPVELNGKLYFTAANAGDVGWDLWRFDGDHSTKILGDDNGWNFSEGAFSFGGVLLLRGYRYGSGEGLEQGMWAFDGTEARLVGPSLWNPNFGGPLSYAVLDGALYFMASQAYEGQLGLWKFDGTTLEPAPGIVPGSLLTLADMKIYDGVIYFGGNGDGSAGNYELWKYDGVEATLAAEILPGEDGSYPESFELHDGSLYFGATDGPLFGNQLWRYSAGTGEATRVTDTLLYGVSNLASLAGILYFSSATSSSIYPRLWSYDGVQVNQVGDLITGSSLFHFNNALYFGADDGLHGSELWKLEPDVPVGDLNRDGTVSIADFITLSSNFGKSNIGWSGGDLNYDNQVSIADFIDLAANFGQSNPQPAAAEATLPVAKKTKHLAQTTKQRRHAHHRVRHHRRAAITLLRL